LADCTLGRPADLILHAHDIVSAPWAKMASSELSPVAPLADTFNTTPTVIRIS